MRVCRAFYRLFFLLVTFLILIKKESETNKCVDYSNYSEKTYSEFVVDLNDIPVLLFYKYNSADTYQIYNIPISNVNFTLIQSTLKFSNHYFFDNFSLFFLPKTKIFAINPLMIILSPLFVAKECESFTDY